MISMLFPFEPVLPVSNQRVVLRLVSFLMQEKYARVVTGSFALF
jgi:hypothetical protein